MGGADTEWLPQVGEPTMERLSEEAQLATKPQGVKSRIISNSNSSTFLAEALFNRMPFKMDLLFIIISHTMKILVLWWQVQPKYLLRNHLGKSST